MPNPFTQGVYRVPPDTRTCSMGSSSPDGKLPENLSKAQKVAALSFCWPKEPQENLRKTEKEIGNN